MLRLALVALVLVFTGCARRADDAPRGEPAQKQAPVEDKAAPEEPVPDPITHPCVVNAAAFDVALAEADGACESASDCDCYPGGVSAKAGCGGVTSAKSAARLHELAQQFRADGCPWAQQCAAQACAPECVDGECR